VELTAGKRIKRLGDGLLSPSPAVRNWIALLAGVLIVWLFMFVIAPWVQTLPAIKPLATFIEETGIDASALYYTEVEEASEAELNMRTTMEYLPAGQ
jgi:hypothetical protein